GLAIANPTKPVTLSILCWVAKKRQPNLHTARICRAYAERNHCATALA
ncbi:MAG: hypothetical protein CG439_2702, partial [Methylococcaceae bacterium NSP1-2]